MHHQVNYCQILSTSVTFQLTAVTSCILDSSISHFHEARFLVLSLHIHNGTIYRIDHIKSNFHSVSWYYRYSKYPLHHHPYHLLHLRSLYLDLRNCHLAKTDQFIMHLFYLEHHLRFRINMMSCCQSQMLMILVESSVYLQVYLSSQDLFVQRMYQALIQMVHS